MNMFSRTLVWMPVWAALLVVLYFANLHNNLLLHSLVELFSIFIAFALFIVAWNTRDYSGSPNLTCLGAAYLSVGFLNLAHVLSYDGIEILRGYDYLDDQIWICARLVKAASLLVFLSIPSRSLKLKAPTALAITGAISAILFSSVFVFRAFPESLFKGEVGIAVKTLAGAGIVAMLAGAFAGLWRNRFEYEGKVFGFLAFSIIAAVANEGIFAVVKDENSLLCLAGHFLKIISFYLLYKGIVESDLREPFGSIFKSLKENQALHRKTQEIGRIGGWEYRAAAKSFSCTEQFKLILGFNSETPDETALAFIMSPGNKLGKEIEGLLEGKIPAFDSEDEIALPEGGKTWIRATGEAELSGRDVKRCFGMLQDIRDRKEAELLKEEMEQIARHDLKTPLNAIIGFSGMLLEDKSLSEQQRRMLKCVNEAGYNLLSMITNSIKMLQMEKGFYKLRLAPVDIGLTVGKALEHLSLRIKEKRLDVHLLRDGGMSPIEVLGEDILCYSMLANLMKNAVEASPEGAALKLELTKEGRFCLLKMTNSGTPPPLIRARFFEKYVSSKTDGIGFGNYSAMLMARMQGGSIEMECSDEEGTTSIMVRLPLCKPQREEPQEADG